MNEKDCCLIGKISKTHGYEGAVTVTLDVDEIQEFEELESVFVSFNGKQVPFFIDSITISGNTNAIVSFLDYHSKDMVEEFVGCSLYLPNDCFPENSGISSQYIGFTVIDLTRGKIGVVESVLQNPAHDLLQVVFKGKETLIPFVDELIVEIDPKAKKIVFDLPEGLLDL